MSEIDPCQTAAQVLRYPEYRWGGMDMKRGNDLGNDPVFPLVLKLAIPTMLAQLVSVLYSIVDRMYIGAGVGDLALAGVGVCGPIVTLLSSFASLVGLGGSPIMAMRMGEGKQDEAADVLWNCFVLLAGLAVALTALFLLGRERMLLWFGASEATFPYANRYLSIYLAGTFFALMSTGMNSFLICQGFSGLGMATVMLGAVMNIILDPILIFGANLGVAGAALASVISQIASCAFVLGALLRRAMPVPLRRRKLAWPVARGALAFGMTPFLTIAPDSVMLIILNTVLQRYGGPGEGDALVTCATIVQSYLLLITMPMGGITLGCQPIISFNYGAGHTGRIRQAMKCIIGLCVGFAAVMLVATHTVSPLFVGLFTQNAALAQRSVRYIKIFTMGILFLAVQYPLVDESTALGQVRLALFCSVFRKCLFTAGLLLLPFFFGAEATFFSEPLADVVAAATSTVLVCRYFPRALAQRERDLAAWG